jgi:hypothetical protein
VSGDGAVEHGRVELDRRLAVRADGDQPSRAFDPAERAAHGIGERLAAVAHRGGDLV